VDPAQVDQALLAREAAAQMEPESADPAHMGPSSAQAAPWYPEAADLTPTISEPLRRHRWRRAPAAVCNYVIL